MKNGLKAQLRCLIMKNKNVPEIRFPEFIDDWELRKLKEIANFIRGSFPQPYTNPEWYDEKNGKPFVQVADIGFDLKLNKDTKAHISKVAEAKSRFVEKGKVIVALQGSIEKSIGRVAITQYSAFFDRTILIFESYKEEIDNQYFAQVIQNLFQIEKEKAWGATISTITKEAVSSFIIGLPNIEEQQKIGIFFKQLDDTIALHQHKLSVLKQAKQGFLQKMFPKEGELVPDLRFPGFTDDWELRNLKDYFGTIISDGDWIEKEHIHEKGEYRIIQTGNIGLGEYIDKKSSAKFMNNLSFKELKANEIFPGDILISRLADPAGRTIILPNTGNKMVTAVDVTIIRPNKNYCSYFFISEMNSKKMLYAISKNVSGTSHKRISRKNLELIILNVPSLEEQKKIGTFFKQIDDTIALQQRELDLLKETKKGFLQKLFV